MIDPASIPALSSLMEHEDDAYVPCDFPGGCTHSALHIYDTIEGGIRRPLYSCGCHLRTAYLSAYISIFTRTDLAEPVQKQALKLIHNNLQQVLVIEEEQEQPNTNSIASIRLLLIAMQEGLLQPADLREAIADILGTTPFSKEQPQQGPSSAADAFNAALQKRGLYHFHASPIDETS